RKRGDASAASAVHEKIVQYAQQPGLHCPFFRKAVQALEGTDTGLLNQILGVRTIAREPVGSAKQRIQVRLDQPVEALVGLVRHGLPRGCTESYTNGGGKANAGELTHSGYLSCSAFPASSR